MAYRSRRLWTFSRVENDGTHRPDKARLTNAIGSRDGAVNQPSGESAISPAGALADRFPSDHSPLFVELGSQGLVDSGAPRVSQRVESLAAARDDGTDRADRSLSPGTRG